MGERAVGEEINKLMLSDYHVYHDLLKKPEDPENRSNIDHIIVGRTGVYAVETKARTIVELKHGGRDDKVTFNGNTLKFPNWENSKDVTQARNHATWLTAYLKSELGLEVEVRGILILPGWNVESKVYNRALRVLEGGRREIKSAIETDTEELLDEQQIKIIVDHFEERCRDVEW